MRFRWANCPGPSGCSPFPPARQPHSSVFAGNLLRLLSIHCPCHQTRWLLQFRYLRNATRRWSPFTCRGIDCSSECHHPARFLSTEGPIRLVQFRDEVVWDSVKCFTQLQVDDISCSTLTQQCSFLRMVFWFYAGILHCALERLRIRCYYSFLSFFCSSSINCKHHFRFQISRGPFH